MKKDFKLYLRLLGYIRPYWRVVAISILAMVVSAALEPVLPALMQPLIDKSLIQRHGASLWQVPVFIVLAFVVKGVADYVANVASQTVAQKTIADLRALIFSHQLDLPIARHRAEEGGRMLSRITYDTSMVGEAVSTAWLTIIRDTLVLIGLLGFLFYTAWQLTLLVLLIAPVLAFAIRRINGRLRQSSKRVQSWMGRVTGLVEEALLGLQEIKIFGAHGSQADRFDQVNQGLRREQMRVVRVQAINVPLVQVLAACSVALVIYVASSLSRQDLLTPGEFVAFITAMSMVFEPVRRLTNVNATLQRGLAAAESIFVLLDERGEGGASGFRSGDKVGRLPQAHGGRQLPPGIEFNSVFYRYPGSNDWSVKDFSLYVPPGQSAALVGPSGSGKSSLLYLLCGFDSPQKGKILINQISVDQIPLQELRAQIALVSQQTLLFDLTVADNLRLAKPDATEVEIVKALKAADAYDFICAIPSGLDTPLGFLGNSLSGGQRQRLTIARAFLKNAPILLLDEATSALDRDSEALVLKGLRKLMVGKTTIIVSHSPERLFAIDKLVYF
jgi:ATP-binding cassette, subfamily B, bacterial MsbA